MAASRCFIFMYFLLPHWEPATWRSRAQTSIRQSCVREAAHYTSTAADLPVQPLNDIVGADTVQCSLGKSGPIPNSV